jgi:hypothetical protein
MSSHTHLKLRGPLAHTTRPVAREAARNATGGFGLLPAGRSTRLLGWLATRREAIHIAQGLLLAFLGALTVAFFRVRYAIPPS